MKVFSKEPGLTLQEKMLLIEFHRNGGDTWSAPTLENSWVDAGSTFQTLRYKKDFWNRVWVEGSVKDGTAVSGTRVFTLPAGYLPAADHEFAAMCSNAGAVDYCTIRVKTAGDVEVYDAAGNTRLTMSFSFEAAA